MSYEAMAWAIKQGVGSPSARCVLMSIANYANEDWCCWPKQETIAKQGVQSVDSVQRRMPELIGDGILRRIKLKRFGRRVHDFYILAPSPFFESSIEEIRPLLPASCDVMDEAERAAADCGSDEKDTPLAPSHESENDAAADCGSAQNSTLPQSAVDATALVRQQEPVSNQRKIPAPTPSKEGVLKNQPQISEAARQRFVQFKAAYPDGIVDLDKAEKEFFGIPDADQEACVTAAPVYAARCRKRREKSKKAHLFIRERAWVGLLATENKTSGVSQYPASTPAGMALLQLGRMARYRPLQFANGNVAFRGEITPALLMLATAPPEIHWLRYERGSPNFAAWRDMIYRVFAGCALPEISQVYAPWPWPPTVDGKTYAGTDPPPGQLSDADVEALTVT